MFDPDAYLRDLIAGCRAVFRDRLPYVGLQGSRLRGEAAGPAISTSCRCRTAFLRTAELG